ncbi:MAG: PaaI family thioesterase [Hyphomonadaceae bacterium]|nr:PaaI family thioesterase [Hyphomonadaceae bacterium]
MAEPPAGFVQVLRAPFINHVGPILQAVENAPGRMTLGLQVEQVHCNTMGFMHGGMIATVCDSAMARATHTRLQRRTVTLRMALEYFDPIQKGDFIEAHGALLNEDGEVAHTECRVMVGGSMRARSTGVFRLLRKV